MDRTAFIATYVDVAASGSFSAALEVFEEFGSVGDAQGVLDLVETLATAQQMVGERWARGELGVAQEHLVTQVSGRILDAMVPLPQLGKGTVVAAVAEGEWHALSCQLLGAGLGAVGWDVVSTGPSMPAAHLTSLVDQLGPRVVVLSCSLAANLPGAFRSISAVRDSGVPVLAGGSGFGTDGRWASIVGADLWAPTISAAVSALDAIPERTTPLESRPGSTEIRTLTSMMPSIVEHSAGDWGVRELSRREDLSLVLRAIHATLLVGDRALFEEHLRWMAETKALDLGPLGVIEMLHALRRHVPEELSEVRAMLDDGQRALQSVHSEV